MSGISCFLICKGAFCLFLGYRVSLSSLGKHPVPHIRQLVQDLPHFFMQDLAPNTKKYSGSFSKWQTWAISKGCSSIPASMNYFLVFLVMQINTCNSGTTFDAIIAGVAWALKKMSFPSPADYTLVKQLISFVHKLLDSLAVNRKLSLLLSHLKLLIEKYKFASLDFLQILTFITLGFVGFLRWDDLINLNINDHSFHYNHLASFFGKA